MTRYMGLVKMAEGITEPPPQSLMDAMDEFVAKSAANGASSTAAASSAPRTRSTSSSARVR